MQRERQWTTYIDLACDPEHEKASNPTAAPLTKTVSRNRRRQGRHSLVSPTRSISASVGAPRRLRSSYLAL